MPRGIAGPSAPTVVRFVTRRFPPRKWRARRLRGVSLLFLALSVLWSGGVAQVARPIVYVVPIEGTIDLGLAPFLNRTLREADRAGAAAVVLDINTLGGRVDAAIAMRDALVNAPIRTIAFVNPRAISAGALLTLAAETVIMAGGGTIGAATPVMAGSGQPQPADEKSVSYVRKEFAATAERRGRPTRLAEAMVDPDVEIAGVVDKGKLLTLTTSEALTHKIADFSAATLTEALGAAGLPDAEQRRMSQNWAETLVRFLTDPIVSSLLMTVGLIGLLVEIRTPGFALPGTIGLLSLALFFWGHWIAQLAGWEEILLVVAGVVLLAVELVVIPGFGVAGVGGIVMLALGLGMTLVGAGASTAAFISALFRVALSALAALAGVLALLPVLPALPIGRRFVLNAAITSESPAAPPPTHELIAIGRVGTARSPLRPAGIADIGGVRVDVVSEGGFIEPGTVIEVTRVDGNRVVVHAAPNQEGQHD